MEDSDQQSSVLIFVKPHLSKPSKMAFEDKITDKSWDFQYWKDE